MKKQPLTRRSFLKRSFVGTSAALALPGCAPEVGEAAPFKLPPGPGTFLFQGDSISDMGRSKEKQSPNTPWSLGNGYVELSTAQILVENPGSERKLYTRGIIAKTGL